VKLLQIPTEVSCSKRQNNEKNVTKSILNNHYPFSLTSMSIPVAQSIRPKTTRTL
jgi:hypothetical protein